MRRGGEKRGEGEEEKRAGEERRRETREDADREERRSGLITPGDSERVSWFGLSCVCVCSVPGLETHRK